MLDMYQPNVTANCKITYTLFWRQGVQISTGSPETKTEFADFALSVRKISKQHFVTGDFTAHYHELIIQN